MRRLEVQMKMWGVVLKWMTPTKSLYHLVGVSMGMFWVKMYSLFGNRSTLTSTNSSRFDDLRNVLKRTWTRASKSVGLPSWFIFNSSDSSEEINGEQATIALKEKKWKNTVVSENKSEVFIIPKETLIKKIFTSKEFTALTLDLLKMAK